MKINETPVHFDFVAANQTAVQLKYGNNNKDQDKYDMKYDNNIGLGRVPINAYQDPMKIFM